MNTNVPLSFSMPLEQILSAVSVSKEAVYISPQNTLKDKFTPIQDFQIMSRSIASDVLSQLIQCSSYPFASSLYSKDFTTIQNQCSKNGLENQLNYYKFKNPIRTYNLKDIQ